MSSGRWLKRRGRELDHVQAVVEIEAETAGRHLAGQIAAGGGDDPHVDGNAAMAAHRDHRPLLDDAEQLGLEFEAEFPDFVEEDGSAVGRAEAAQRVAVGPGKRPLDVAKELAGKQRCGNGGAVDGDQRPGGRRTCVVDGPRRSVPCRFRWGRRSRRWTNRRRPVG